MGTSLSPNVTGLAGGDAEVAVERGDQPACDGVAVDGGDRRARVLEDPQVRLAVTPVPRADGVGAAAAEDLEAVLEVDAGREHVTLSGQHHRQLAELAFEPVEGAVQVGKEARILHVDLVGVHAHDGASVRHFNVPSHVVSWWFKPQDYAPGADIATAQFTQPAIAAPSTACRSARPRMGMRPRRCRCARTGPARPATPTSLDSSSG